MHTGVITLVVLGWLWVSAGLLLLVTGHVAEAQVCATSSVATVVAAIAIRGPRTVPPPVAPPASLRVPR